ncbi:glycosyltransferase family 17 protein [Phycomyces blakesleeanus NRRL 1555(-)]|uniref:Glycosyltransferase family 17 protein n=2 Tax=Phycomyces blakesleeanus TaxID=4837 RepID=A0A167MY57_PHYB8|nr:glycosyltransferase family 17 protein [Phycomyces blakesleeanus NRRL 1555(-)]OAD74484.1 glycosyltransferase family 17 protein [Phycomyces blakesleeanus NRRL 1555(-)]|eukprot:XP_018292524.1 glycosyltransferase family 17 protein [Phycomyces blakesleeanus NRRL 1555(-)]
MWLFFYHTGLITDLGYYTRPLWDSNPQSFNLIPHYYAEDVPMKDLCKLHGWTLKKKEDRPRVFDAIIFSVELDLLEIRIHELWDTVDIFIILESNATFTGSPKELVFKDNKERFAFGSSKIRHYVIDQFALPPGEGPFWNENEMRREMNNVFIKEDVQKGDLILMSDVDEIVRSKSLEILKSCAGVPELLHLQLRNYLYSFEFLFDDQSWRAHVETFIPGQTIYRHGQVTQDCLVDAGWHCSFCFRTIKEFQFKMQSYSHADRVRNPGLLEADRIQKVICDGGEIFDMPPEAYNYRELISKIGNIPKDLSAVGLPSFLLKNAQKFKFLMPGGCIRDDVDTY